MLFERKVLIVTQWHGSSNRKLKISAVSNSLKSPEAELYIAILFPGPFQEQRRRKTLERH